MKAYVKQQYQDFVEYVEFPTLVYIYETGRIIAANNDAIDIIGKNHKNMNTIWENQTRLKFRKEVLNNGNDIIFNQSILVDNKAIEVDIEINAFIVDKVHIMFCFFEESYKQRYIKYLSSQVPRLFWKDKRLSFLGGSYYFKQDVNVESHLCYLVTEDLYEKETSESIKEDEKLILSQKECQYNVIQQFKGINGKGFFAKLHRMPIINKNGTGIGMIGVYSLILNRDAYKNLFDTTLHINNILNKAVSRADSMVVSWTAADGWPVEYMSPNFRRYGYNINDFYTKKLVWKDIVHPDDYDKVYQEVKNCNGYTALEYRIRKANGEIVWVKDETVSVVRKNKICHREGMLKDITLQKKIASEVNSEEINTSGYDTHKDFITGLPNRYKFESDVVWHITQAIDLNKQGYVVLFDLDDFKHINDGLGHEYGDILLRHIAQFLISIPEIADWTYRVGGDEFLFIIPSEFQERAEQIVSHIFETFRKPWKLYGKEYFCTMSMGVTTYPNDSNKPVELLRFADIAMFESKRTGKNKVSYYKTTHNDKSIERINLEKYLRKAITKGCVEFDVYYQPVVNSKTKELTGAEALLRWKSPELGFICPVDFISLSEYLGLIVPLGEFVLHEAFSMCKLWNDKFSNNFTMNINLSVVQLIQPDIIQRIIEIANRVGINCNNIVFEVTESLAIEDMELMKSVLGELKTHGFRIALDDFGTGYSSLNHIMEIPLDYIKIDRSFISNYGTKQFNPVLLSAITDLAHSMDVEVIVEGVETKQQMEFLMFLNTDKYQGFLYGHPVPKKEFVASYKSKS
jgi:diguanylate cyclase (GGDEF)-like protein